MTTSIVDTREITPVGQPTDLRRRRMLALLPGIASGLYLIWSATVTTPTGRRFTLFDDAMISMTYARTLSRGGGLVWYEGAPRVEGITNPLWTFYMAVLHAIGLEGSNAALAVALTGLATVLVTALAAGRIARSIRPGSHTAEIATVTIVPLLFPLMYWSVRGMEVGLVCAVTFVTIALAIRMREPAEHGGAPDADARRRVVDLVLVGTCLVVGLMTRPDFVTVAVVVVAWLALSARSRRERIDALVFLGVGCAAMISVMTIDRLLYFGEAVPNTYTLKATGVATIERIGRGIITDFRLVPTLLVGTFALWVLWPDTSGRRRGALVLVIAMGLAAVAYSTFVGGDAWEVIPNRYVTPTLVAVTIIVASAFGESTELSRRARRYFLIAFAAAVPFLVAVLTLGIGITDGGSGRAGLVFGALLPAVAMCVATAVPARPELRSEPPLRLLLTSLALLLTTSATGWFVWSTQDWALMRRHDQEAVTFGDNLRKVTSPDAVVAHYYAGAPAYYADRKAVDLLGKSDPYIARSEPRTPFFPGHDKWDYAWTIDEYAPDVIAGLWKPGEADFETLRNAGYEQRCFDEDWVRPWVRVASPRVRLSSPLFVPCRP